MSNIVYDLLPILSRVMGLMVVVYLAMKAFREPRFTAWIELIGAVLLVAGIIAPLIHTPYKTIRQNPNSGAEIMAFIEPYWTIVQTSQLLGAIMVIWGLSVDIWHICRVSLSSH